jgi:hyperosmotically inducible protein
MKIPIIRKTSSSWVRRVTPVLALPPAPDNTKTNARDRQPGQATADDQKNDRTDLQIAQEIRKALMADKSLSTYAHNVKVVARHGKVTLKGPVRTTDEKKVVETRAAEIAGVANVTSQLSVAPDAASKKAGS